MSLRERLTALFSPTWKLLAADAPVLSAGGRLGGVEWVVPRAWCQYHRLDLSGLPQRRRSAAAMLAARQYESGPQARSQIAWSGALAHVWTWEGAGDDPAPDGGIDWIPETLLRPPMLADGVRLLRQAEGYEGQYWQGATLRASRWWANPPSLDSWSRFLRGCGLPGVAAVPTAEAVGWATRPWASRGWRLPASPARLERLAWQGIFGLLLLLAGWQLAAVGTWSVARERLDDSLSSLRARATPLLEARERAEVARATLDGYRELAGGGLDDYLLMAEVARGLPEDGQLTAWRRDRERLQVEIQSADLDPRRFVSAYAASHVLRDALASPGNNGQMQLDFTVTSPAAVEGIE